MKSDRGRTEARKAAEHNYHDTLRARDIFPTMQNLSEDSDVPWYSVCGENF